MPSLWAPLQTTITLPFALSLFPPGIYEVKISRHHFLIAGLLHRLFFYPENGDSISLRNVGLPLNSMVSKRSHQYENFKSSKLGFIRISVYIVSFPTSFKYAQIKSAFHNIPGLFAVERVSAYAHNIYTKNTLR
jgi:hypothetical protein